MEINIKPILGNWTHGWALDQHTVRSTGEPDGFIRPTFDTERTEIGEAIYRLKYRNDLAQVEPIARTIAEFIRGRSELWDIKAILAVPPSEWRRSFQPVEAVASRIGEILGLPSSDEFLLKARPTLPLKGISDKRRRRKELDDAFSVLDQRFAGRHVLLFDDLYRSGETLKAVTAALLFQGQVAMVSVVTATSTRSNR
ncbi:MAG: ComF family protein [Acidobacteria bacterium]|jgi:predicted amidophosphoribosyltransferase|nr:ComF family protein [Acidobacteriota bacterium]